MAQKTVEIPQAQVPDTIVDVPVVVQHQVPKFIDDMAQETEKFRGEDEVDKAKVDAKYWRSSRSSLRLETTSTLCRMIRHGWSRIRWRSRMSLKPNRRR